MGPNFLPHLSHLRTWYDQEADAIPNTSSRLRKMKLLDKVYDEILDSGTYQFAVYYKEWLTAGIEAPAVPSIHVPTASVCGISHRSSHGHSPESEPTPTGSASSQPMMSKILYEAVSGCSNKSDGSNEVNDDEGEENFTTCARRSFDGTIEDDTENNYFPEPGTFKGQRIQEGPLTNSVDAPLPITVSRTFLLLFLLINGLVLFCTGCQLSFWRCHSVIIKNFAQSFNHWKLAARNEHSKKEQMQFL